LCCVRDLISISLSPPTEKSLPCGDTSEPQHTLMLHSKLISKMMITNRESVSTPKNRLFFYTRTCFYFSYSKTCSYIQSKLNQATYICTCAKKLCLVPNLLLKLSSWGKSRTYIYIFLHTMMMMMRGRLMQYPAPNIYTTLRDDLLTASFELTTCSHHRPNFRWRSTESPQRRLYHLEEGSRINCFGGRHRHRLAVVSGLCCCSLVVSLKVSYPPTLSLSYPTKCLIKRGNIYIFCPSDYLLSFTFFLCLIVQVTFVLRLH
jgi:hypothetical protein